MSKAQEPVAYLVTNGRTFSDRAFTHLYHAEASVAERKDGSTIVPLYTPPASSEQQAAQHDAALVKPDAGRYVLAWMEGREVPIRAMWVPAKWLLANDAESDDWAEYDKSQDEYFCPEGWYEKNEHELQNWRVDHPVVAWMELPRLAARASNGGKA